MPASPGCRASTPTRLDTTMSRIFRSDEVQPGDRVVLRRIAPEMEDKFSDIIGHIVSVTPTETVIRPQDIGGMPSFKDGIVVPAADIKIVKKLSPRTIRNSDIRKLEVAYSKAFPGIEHRQVGQWLLRAGDGITERSNSAAPLGPSALFDPVPVAEIHEFYSRHGLPPLVLVPERIGRVVEKLVERLGPEIIVMARKLGDEVDVEKHAEFRIDTQPDDDWLRLYHFRGKPLPRRALELLRTQIDGEMGFGRLLIDGRTVAITRGTITDGYLGYSAVEVAPEYRRQGLGTQLGNHMLNWGLAHGAHPAAVRGNGPGLQVLWLLRVFGKARLVGKGRLDVGKPHPGEDGHPIPLVEAMVRNLVAGERIEWKLFVLTLGFLHQQHINIKAGEGRHHSIHAGADGVYVPVSNAHACYITKKSPGFSAGHNDVGDVPEIQVWYTD